jgi:ketosteroid isomerase-like protein
VLNRSQVLDAVAKSSPWQEVELSEVSVAEYGDAAVVAYRARGVRGTGDPYTTYASSVYVRSGSEWKLALHQQTPIPDA